MKRKNLLIGLIILITVLQPFETKATEISFSSSLGCNKWFLGNDFFFEEGDGMIIDLKIDSFNQKYENETNLEVYVESPSDPNEYQYTINIDDYWTITSYILEWSCKKGNQGLAQFKFRCTGNNLTWINFSGVQYFYDNSFLELKDVNICNNTQFNGSQRITWNFHPDLDNDSCYVDLWFKPNSHDWVELDYRKPIVNNSYSYLFNYRDNLLDENGSLLYSNGTFNLEVAEAKSYYPSGSVRHSLRQYFLYTVYFDDPRLKIIYETENVTEIIYETVYVTKTEIAYDTSLIIETSIVEITKATTDFVMIPVIVLILIGIVVKKK